MPSLTVATAAPAFSVERVPLTRKGQFVAAVAVADTTTEQDVAIVDSAMR